MKKNWSEEVIKAERKIWKIRGSMKGPNLQPAVQQFLERESMKCGRLLSSLVKREAYIYASLALAGCPQVN